MTNDVCADEERLRKEGDKKITDVCMDSPLYILLLNYSEAFLEGHSE